MKTYKRKSVFSNLKKYDILADKDDYIEITEWKNGEGFDVDISTKDLTRFQLTWGQFRALLKVVEKIDGREIINVKVNKINRDE